jgi:hypothetical protein
MDQPLHTSPWLPQHAKRNHGNHKNLRNDNCTVPSMEDLQRIQNEPNDYGNTAIFSV